MNVLFSILLSLIFKGVLDFIYVVNIAPKYYYAGLSYYLAPAIIVILSYLLIIPFSYLCAKLPNRPSKLVINLLFLFAIIPASTLMAFGGFEVWPMIILCVGFITLIVALKIPNPMLKQFQLTSSNYPVILFIMSLYAFGIIVLIAQYGIKLPTHIVDIYSQRAEFKQSLSSSMSGTAYIVSWLGNVVIPFLFIYSITKKRYWPAFLAFIALLEVFGVGGNKSFLFSIIIIIGVYIGTISYLKSSLSYYSFGLICIVLFCYFADKLASSLIWTSIFVRRLLLAPAQLYYSYYDFISHNEFTLLSQSVFGFFIRYPYEAPLPSMIGKYYYHSYDTNANANFFADAYANFGIAGVIVFSLVLGLILTTVDNVSGKKDLRLIYPLLAMPCISLANSALLTSLLTHGIMLVFLTITLMSQNQYNVVMDQSEEIN